jgi:hypothetical protein
MTPRIKSVDAKKASISVNFNNGDTDEPQISLIGINFEDTKYDMPSIVTALANYLLEHAESLKIKEQEEFVNVKFNAADLPLHMQDTYISQKLLNKESS